MSQPDHHAVLQDFFKWERQSRVEAVADITTDEKAEFMPIETLRSYFQANGSKNLVRILSEIFRCEDIPINPEVILRGHSAVFCILLRISKGKYIEHFVRFDELSDQRLPLDQTHPPACFPEATNDPNFLARFCDIQWMYCVPKFDNHMQHRHFVRQRLLPITHKERRGGGGSAIIYKIKLYGPHNKLLPAGSQKMDNTNPNTFILKRYLTRDAEDHYKQEVNGYWNLKHPESIIGFYGSYTHGDDYNILLEFADKGSLEEYFQRETPPSRGSNIIKFWDGLFQLIKALKAIHSILGWHQDVKPANVLVVSYGAESPFDWQFKLADFGLSHFISKIPSEGDAMANDSRGTRTYGAPDCYMPYNLDDQIGRSSTKITQAVDIWSLGCIFSEAAMWIADGYKGVVDYRRQRMAEIDEIPNFKGGDCFHDGERVLKAVLDAHRDIESRLRRSDYITKDVLESMVDDMLWEEDRPNAKALWRKAEVVLHRAGEKLSKNTTEEFPNRPNNSRYLTYPPPKSPPRPPPEQPRLLPPGLSFPERQYPANVETWRAQISTPSAGFASPKTSSYGGGLRNNHDSIIQSDKELTGSTASWQGGSGSPLASPLTSPFTSPHVSTQYDFKRHLSTEGRNRPLQSQRSSGQKRPNEFSYGESYMNTAESLDEVSTLETLDLHTEPAQQSTTISLVDHEESSVSIVDSPTIGRESIYSSSDRSIPIMRPPPAQNDPPSYPFSPEDVHVPPKSQKRPKGLSLFPSRTYTLPTHFAPSPPAAGASTLSDQPVARSESLSRNFTVPVPTNLNNSSHFVEHISLAAALEWKKAHKSKKHAKVPSLPGANSLAGLKDRDHVFIIDDGFSMREHWSAVKMMFEAVSYILKPMSPDGIELYFTISYDTWRRHNTSELSGYLEKKTTVGETDISYRLGLQLQGYIAKIQSTSGKASKSKKLRPLSLYILTDGNWKTGGDPKTPIKEIADQLIAAGLKDGQVTIQFVEFGQNASGLQRMRDLLAADFGLDIVDITPSTGNILKILRGPLDKSLFQGTGTVPSVSSSSTFTVPAPAPYLSELA